MRQSTAVKVLASGASVFLTGAPGAGKTHLLNRFIRYLREREIPIAITASTGIAATHIGGMTLHSWSGLGIREEVDDRLLEKLLEKKYLRTRFEKTKVLIIDEISMLSPRLFSAVSTILQNVRFSPEPFGGIQVVVTGDFFQLPPVSRTPRKERFVWQCAEWKNLNPHICYLSERHRHSESDFLELLDEIRMGKVSPKSHTLLESRKNTNISVTTRLFPHNADVDAINAEELQKIKSASHQFSLVSTGNPKIAEVLLQNSIVVPELELKKGALVMFIKNNPEKAVVNGTLGEVIGFEQENGFPIVRTKDERTIVAEPAEWSVKDERDRTLAAIAQIPLRLAWAITVHKSQGMTLDSAEIDLRNAFEPGHGYVALSRVKNLSGLNLLGYNEMALSVNREVLAVDAEMQRKSRETEAQYFNEPIREKYAEAQVSKEKYPPKIPTIEKTRRLLEKGLSFAEVAEEREITLATVIKHFQELLEMNVITFPIDHLAPPKEILQKIETAKNEVQKRNLSEDKTEKGEIRLGAIFRELKEEISYDEIRLALIFSLKDK